MRRLRQSGGTILAIAFIFSAASAGRAEDDVIRGLRSGDPIQIRDAVVAVRTRLILDPIRTVDRLNQEWMVGLMDAKEFSAVDEFAITGTVAVPADTWRIEQLQKHRIKAFLAQNRPVQALAVAKSLFNVCGMGFAKEALALLRESLEAAYPNDPGRVNRFKMQMLASSQEIPIDRQRMIADYGDNTVMRSIDADPSPYRDWLSHNGNIGGYRGLYGVGNVLLMSGRIAEARQIFKQVYLVAPAGEMAYASEGIAKVMKAEDGGLGRANEFIMSLTQKK